MAFFVFLFFAYFRLGTVVYAAGPLDTQEGVSSGDLQPLSDEELLLNQNLLNLIEKKMLSFPEVQKDAPPQFVDKLLSDTERRNPQTLYSLFSDLEENKEGSQLLQRFAGLRE